MKTRNVILALGLFFLISCNPQDELPVDECGCEITYWDIQNVVGGVDYIRLGTEQTEECFDESLRGERIRPDDNIVYNFAFYTVRCSNWN